MRWRVLLCTTDLVDAALIDFDNDVLIAIPSLHNTEALQVHEKSTTCRVPDTVPRITVQVRRNGPGRHAVQVGNHGH